MPRRITFALAALTAGAAAAQSAQPDPSSPRGKPAAQEYRSAFEGYRPFTEDKPAAWRDANEAVKRQGGQAGHGEKPAVEGKAPPKPQGHEGHK